MRVGLSPSPSAVTVPPPAAAAARKKAAAEKSPGTRILIGVTVAGPRTDARLPPPASGSTSTGTPAASSRRSVWSRAAPGTATDVVPRAWSPASRTAEATWALATGSV